MSKSLFEHNYNLKWPAGEKFPINEETQGRIVKDQLLPDIQDTEDFLIITGFASIANIVEVFGATDYPKLKKLRIVLGSEPFARVGKKLSHYPLPTEIKNYWLKQNVSIKLCGPLINLIEKIKKKEIVFRALDNLHSKIYVGDHYSILGSSNFSKKGIITQREANIRVEKSFGITESVQFESMKQIAENYFDLSGDYTKGILDLLNSLLRDVDWDEALARALAEILESNWMKDFPILYQAIVNMELWPSQRIGISHAMKIIQDQGNVLLADPTGSGKTKLATTLAYTLFHWLGENGLKDRSNALIISPAQVMENWDREQEHFKILNRIESMGKLSNSTSTKRVQLQREIDNVDILVIDEAHNYLHPGSKRSKAITPKGSTHVILSTATPINKRPDDLLRLIELLDVDNLSDDDLKEFIELRKNKNKKVDEQYLKKLKKYINQFIVRRTKKELNEMIHREPEKYLNGNKHKCHYPKTHPHTYSTGETESDKLLAAQIRELCSRLRGINYLTTLDFPFYVRTEDEKQFYLKQRLNSSPALAAFMIRAALRSSHCALIEYLNGTDDAKKLFAVDSSKSRSGNVIHSIIRCKSKFPQRNFPNEWLLPNHEWLTSPAKYLVACDEEISIYEEISKLGRKFSGEREKEKAKTLIDKVTQYGKILAFDSTILTLDYLKKLLLELKVEAEVIVATGQSESSKKLVKQSFALQNSEQRKLIALCSDAMSEGINLPDGKALVLLDMPSVLRIIEQRIGRLERMDSEHEEIHVFWPNDSEEFSLKGDARLVDILVTTEKLIRGNVDIPKILYDRYLKNQMSTDNFIKAFEDYSENEYEWEGVKDSTQYLYGLKEGEDALISDELYNQFKDVEAAVKTAISFVETDTTWSFFAFKGDSTRSPKWLLIDSSNKTHTDFPSICNKLREYLQSGKIIQRRWKDVEVDSRIKIIIRQLRQKEEDLLPWKKKRALKTARRILEKLIKHTSVKDVERLNKIKRVRDLLNPEFDSENLIDLNHLAELWLSILLPALDKKRKLKLRKKRVITLDDLTASDVALTEKQLDKIFENCQYASTLDEIIAACIIGIKKTND